MFGLGGSDFEGMRDWAKVVVENRLAFGIFFGAVGLYLDQEIEKANAGAGNEAARLIRRGRMKKPVPAREWFGSKSMELKMGQVRTCTLSLSGICDADLKPRASLIEADLESEENSAGDIRRERIAFVLESRLSGTVAYRAGPDGHPRPQEEFGAPEIAQTVVNGMLRGHFDSLQ